MDFVRLCEPAEQRRTTAPFERAYEWPLLCAAAPLLPAIRCGRASSSPECFSRSLCCKTPMLPLRGDDMQGPHCHYPCHPADDLRPGPAPLPECTAEPGGNMCRSDLGGNFDEHLLRTVPQAAAAAAGLRLSAQDEPVAFVALLPRAGALGQPPPQGCHDFRI